MWICCLCEVWQYLVSEWFLQVATIDLSLCTQSTSLVASEEKTDSSDATFSFTIHSGKVPTFPLGSENSWLNMQMWESLLSVSDTIRTGQHPASLVLCLCVRGVFICMFSLSYLLVDTFQAVQIPLLMHASLNRQVLLSSLVVTVRYTAGLHANS